jgi:hypothetical protein
MRMKKALWILAAVILLHSCSLFEKPSMTQQEIDAMVAQLKACQEENASTIAKYEAELAQIKANQAALLKEQEEQSRPSSGTYYVIVGSFKTPKYANDYAATIKGMGGDGMIIDGPSDFQFVSMSGHSSLREAINAMNEARMNIVSEAWIYRVR